jgi:hypothetical protein
MITCIEYGKMIGLQKEVLQKVMEPTVGIAKSRKLLWHGRCSVFKSQNRLLRRQEWQALSGSLPRDSVFGLP